jgi:hypothetical protein
MQPDMTRRLNAMNHVIHHSYKKHASVPRRWTSTNHIKNQLDEVQQKEFKDTIGTPPYK